MTPFCAKDGDGAAGSDLAAWSLNGVAGGKRDIALPALTSSTRHWCRRFDSLSVGPKRPAPIPIEALLPLVETWMPKPERLSLFEESSLS